MTAPAHTHTCVEVGRLNGELESLRQANRAFAAENARLRLDALTDDEAEAAATGLDAYIRLCGSRLPDDHRIRAVAATLAARRAERVTV
ncbi:hypothetical protein [Micromonospora sp. NPDC050695]|uniref:hypothetical protein n=1 Tax=Micromonospora sp. NPDC050695 TaxID=3154938 RepID=UPI0033CF2E0E